MNPLNTAQLVSSTFIATLVAASCSTSSNLSQLKTTEANSSDPNQYLEQIETPEALAWVKSHNDKSIPLLQNNELYPALHDEIHKILVAKDRLAYPGIVRSGYVYNFWQDSGHIKGLWRRMPTKAFIQNHKEWETVIDVDQLASLDHQSYVWKGATCFEPENKRCLIHLSLGGGDAVITREFDIPTKLFVKDGFILPEAKTETSWLDENTLWVGTNFGPNSLTKSGYPRIVKLWKRGTPLTDAKTVYETSENEISAQGYTVFSAEPKPVSILAHSPSFFESEQFFYSPSDNKKHVLPMPMNTDFKGIFKNRVLVMPRTDWKHNSETIPTGTLIAIHIDDILNDVANFPIEILFKPTAHTTLASVEWTKDAIYLNVLSDVKSSLLELTPKLATSPKSKTQWSTRKVNVPKNGSISLLATSPYESELFYSFESFLIPTTIYSLTKPGATPQKIASLPARFDSKPYVVEQRLVPSLDGTKIPYFLIHKKNLKHDSAEPALLYGYGGFEVSETPFYLGAIGKVWLERGGVYALANIRGGGEYGPNWHLSAILENRQRVYDDFIAVAENLISTHITSPNHLGIMGGSNGGLLMGVMLTKRPDLFKAIVCQVPLLDMLRYTKLPTGAGASWAGEYGNPDNPKMREVLAKYSPYQNLHLETKYPEAFFESSTEDDRVSPAHARKMVAKLESLNNPVIYFENTEGGHSAAADLEQRAKRSAMEFTYLWSKLGPKSGSEILKDVVPAKSQ